ncbi:ParB/Srx family N-terminal domain-containing protein [Mesorhizobium sp. M0768]|uniref:ParB/Srx family N-terminal domain-containing protein n=1 Tax=Mesorhizobium sp. M0768 TaxID=2956996 RepID=UPI00333BCF95
MEKIQVNVSQLLLDLENPRIVSADTQPDALRSMIEFDPRHFKTMMESIKDHGLDPGDAFCVIASEIDPDEFIVVDGNRRLAALTCPRRRQARRTIMS